MRREWVEQALKTGPGMADYCAGRVIQSESLNRAPKTKPFLIFKLGNTSRDNRVHTARRQYLTVYVHDEADPGEYTRIDAGVDLVIAAIEGAAPSPEDHIIVAEWLETSADFDDKELGTILRYVRFSIVLSQITQ